MTEHFSSFTPLSSDYSFHSLFPIMFATPLLTPNFQCSLEPLTFLKSVHSLVLRLSILNTLSYVLKSCHWIDLILKSFENAPDSQSSKELFENSSTYRSCEGRWCQCWSTCHCDWYHRRFQGPLYWLSFSIFVFLSLLLLFLHPNFLSLSFLSPFTSSSKNLSWAPVVLF